MFDIAIIGGGVIGSSIAYHLMADGRAKKVCVIEPDPTYEFASTPRSAGGFRRLFTRPENVRLSAYSIDFFLAFEERMAIAGALARIGLRRQGYLFVVPGSGKADMEANFRVQSQLGVPAQLLSPAKLKERFPSLNVKDVAIATYSPEDGWLDPHGVLMGFRRKGESLGATYIADRVTGIEVEKGRVRRLVLARGGKLAVGMAVNAAGAWSPEVARLVGMRLPIETLRRMVFYFETDAKVEPLPLVKDLTGLFVRPEGAGYICGVPNMDEAPGVNFDVDYDYFERVVWPHLANRVPAFESLKVKRGWAGLYDQNRFDGNLIIGPWEGEVDNFHVACGFSGHGLQQSPAVGLAMSELLLDGAFRTFDLSAFSYRRVVENRPVGEQGIV